MSAMEESDTQQAIDVNINSFSTGSISQLAKIFNKGGTGAPKEKEEKKGLLAGMTSGLGKLGMIAGLVGIAVGMVKMLVSSSPMLKQILKLFNFGIMLILRPIGDFIGFMLRPIMLMVLTKFILPFYQNALPMMQEMGAMVGETLVPIVEKIIIGIIAVGKIVGGFWLALFTFLNPWMETDTSLLDSGISEMKGLFTGVNTTNDNLVTLDNDLIAQSKLQIAATKTGFGDLPEMTDKMKGLQTKMLKFSGNELTKMVGLLGKDKTNVAGVGAANTAVAVAAARGDASTFDELKNIWYKTLMNEGGWTKMPDGKTFGETTPTPQVIEIKVEGMNGNYTSAEKYQFQQAVVEVIEKERAKRPR